MNAAAWNNVFTAASKDVRLEQERARSDLYRQSPTLGYTEDLPSEGPLSACRIPFVVTMPVVDSISGGEQNDKHNGRDSLTSHNTVANREEKKKKKKKKKDEEDDFDTVFTPARIDTRLNLGKRARKAREDYRHGEYVRWEKRRRREMVLYTSTNSDTETAEEGGAEEEIDAGAAEELDAGAEEGVDVGATFSD